MNLPFPSLSSTTVPPPPAHNKCITTPFWHGRWYVKQIENTLIQTCGEFGVHAKTTEDTGVWVGNEKIAAIGIVMTVRCTACSWQNRLVFHFMWVKLNEPSR